MEDAGFFSSDVKAIIVEYTVYHPSEDIFVNTHAVLHLNYINYIHISLYK